MCFPRNESIKQFKFDKQTNIKQDKQTETKMQNLKQQTKEFNKNVFISVWC